MAPTAEVIDAVHVARTAAPQVRLAVVNVVVLKFFKTDMRADDLIAVARPVTLRRLAKALDGLLPGSSGKL